MAESSASTHKKEKFIKKRALRLIYRLSQEKVPN
jgi:hypothetical protein